MGLIRTLLALCVVVFHSYSVGGYGFVGGKVAVQSFYLISGFYMALILNEKYYGERFSYRNFITSRLLRILPGYFFVLALSFLVSAAGLFFWNNPYYFGMFVPHWEHLNWATRILLISENFLLLGQDWLFFLKVNFQDGSLSLTAKAFFEKQPLIFNSFMFVPQAWSLSLEICFYLLAPFIIRSKMHWQIILVAASLALRYYLIKTNSWRYDPWTYRFFPNEIAFFVSGALLYPIYLRIKNFRYSGIIGKYSQLFLILLILLYDRIKIDEYNRCWYFYGILFLLLPFVFCTCKNSKVDRLIGELSFPIYLIHHLIMFILKQYFWTHTQHMAWFGVSCVALTIPAAWLFYRYFIVGFDNYRYRITLQKTVTD